MKKIIAWMICLPLLCMTAYAADDAGYHGEEAWKEMLRSDEITTLYEDLPGETGEYLERIGMGASQLGDVTSIDTGSVLQSLWEMTRNEAKTPLGTAALLLALLLAASLFQEGETTLPASMSPAAETVMSLTVSLTLALPVIALIEQAAQTVSAACTFSESFAAVFIGILLSGGQPASAAGYGTFLFGATELSTLCISQWILPVLKVLLALSCVAAVSDEIRVDAIIQFFEKNAKWILSFMAVLLSSFLGISGILSASADNIASRTAKFVISGSVPVIGGAMSDAYLSMKSGLLMLRNSVGAFGIIAVAYIYLPLILRTVLWRLVMEFAMAVCEMLRLNQIHKLVKSLFGTLSLMLCVLVFSLFLLTLGSIIIMLQKNG